ncbi:alpha-tocopherol transfer protein-like isoform X2 [Neodiprion virginianus]|uniref:alpha-tocopherol transfer protein-like isoform X2 n=3 Tax=Neodiprion virginianus TaxID=2961670 RepID=UPI001EE6A6C9|nr:alpha-tocopherol transfer protein-like isoform X2 [Neodiprion virginianus]
MTRPANVEGEFASAVNHQAKKPEVTYITIGKLLTRNIRLQWMWTSMMDMRYSISTKIRSNGNQHSCYVTKENGRDQLLRNSIGLQYVGRYFNRDMTEESADAVRIQELHDPINKNSERLPEDDFERIKIERVRPSYPEDFNHHRLTSNLVGTQNSEKPIGSSVDDTECRNALKNIDAEGLVIGGETDKPSLFSPQIEFRSEDQEAGNFGPSRNGRRMPEPKIENEPDDEEVALDLSEPPEEVMEYARTQLGETDEVKCLTIDELRDMIYERGECTPHRMDDAFLIRFLRARRFNVNKAHRLVVNYYNFKDDHPDIHRGLNPLEMRHIGDDDIMTVPAYRTQCGRRMMIFRIGNWDPRKYSIIEIFKATVVVLELGVLEPRAQILGGVVIFDLEGLAMAHAWTVTPQIASMVLALMVTSFPIKSHAIHILHQSWVFDAIFAVFKPLLDARMRDKIFFHGSDMESLHRHVVPTSLPKKYGGTRNELPYYKWIDSLSKNPTIVKEMQLLGYIASEEIIKNLET